MFVGELAGPEETFAGFQTGVYCGCAQLYAGVQKVHDFTRGLLMQATEVIVR